MGACFSTPHPLRSALVSPISLPRGGLPPRHRGPDPAVEALLAGGGVMVSSATQLTVGDGTLANALPTQDAPRRGILVAPPAELLGDETDAELTAGGRPATGPNPLPLPGIDEAAPDTQVSRASAQPTVHPGEPLEGGAGDSESPVLRTSPPTATDVADAAAPSSSDAGLPAGAATVFFTSSDGGLTGMAGGEMVAVPSLSEGGLATAAHSAASPAPAPEGRAAEGGDGSRQVR